MLMIAMTTDDSDPFAASNFAVSELYDPMLDESECVICALLGVSSVR